MCPFPLSALGDCRDHPQILLCALFLLILSYNRLYFCIYFHLLWEIKQYHCTDRHITSSGCYEHVVTNSLSLCVAKSMYSEQQFNAPPVKTWKYVGFLCSNILQCSNNIIPDERDFHRLCSLVDLPVCGKINEHTVCVLVLRNFQMCLLVTMFLSNHCRCSFIASHTKRNPGKTRCIPAGKGMGSQQAFGI